MPWNFMTDWFIQISIGFIEFIEVLFLYREMGELCTKLFSWENSNENGKSWRIEGFRPWKLPIPWISNHQRIFPTYESQPQLQLKINHTLFINKMIKSFGNKSAI